jgi:GxxExxY protein
MDEVELNQLSGKIVNAAYQVHKTLGPGLLEHVYSSCLKVELQDQGLELSSEVLLPVIYKDHLIDLGYRLDLLVACEIIVELKAVEQLAAVHKAQLLTYLKLTHKRLGLLINFNVPLIKDGIHRLIL